MQAPPTPPSSELVARFVALAEGVLPRDGFADWHAGRTELPAAARRHPSWRAMVDALESEPGVVRFLEPGGFQTSTGVGFTHLTASHLLEDLLLATWQRLDIT